jgi:hypothetical protein
LYAEPPPGRTNPATSTAPQCHPVLAMFGDWREQEVVVNPDYLRGQIEVAGTVAESAETINRRAKWMTMFGTD